jgi:hypothetical protein
MEENMKEQISETSAHPLVSSSPPVKLWTPGVIAGVTFLLGFPSGIVLASINWLRMNMRNKALTHLIAGAIGTFIFSVLLVFIPGNTGRAVALVANLGILFYLQQQMKKDVETFKATNNSVGKANEFGGCLIGLGILVLFLVSLFMFGFVLALLGVPIPE